MYSRFKTSNGFSLVGLLVAVLLSSILINGLISIFSSNHNASRLMFDYGGIQDSARVANQMLIYSLRQANHFGGLNNDDISPHASLAITGVGSCNLSWITNTEEPVRAYDGASAISGVSGLPSGCIDSAVYEPDTDILVVRYASPVDMAKISAVSATEVYIRTVIGGTGAQRGEIFLGSTGSTIGGTTDPVGTYNYRYSTELYYIRKCSLKISGTCKDEIPSLVRLQLNGNTLEEQLLIEGVEQFQIEFGVDSDGNLTAEQYLSASSITNWDQVISARYSVVVRGQSKDLSQTDSNAYSLAGNVTFIADSANQNYKRRVYTKVVQLRNMIRG